VKQTYYWSRDQELDDADRPPVLVVEGAGREAQDPDGDTDLY
jgi:hypothetical protein